MRKVSVGLDVVLCVLMAGMVGPPAVRFFVTSTIETSYARHVNTLLLLVGVGAVIMRVVLEASVRRGAGKWKKIRGRTFSALLVFAFLAFTVLSRIDAVYGVRSAAARRGMSLPASTRVMAVRRKCSWDMSELYAKLTVDQGEITCMASQFWAVKQDDEVFGRGVMQTAGLRWDNCGERMSHEHYPVMLFFDTGSGERAVVHFVKVD